MDVRQAAKIFGDTPEVLNDVYTHLREQRQQSAAEKLSATLECLKAEMLDWLLNCLSSPW